MLSFFPCQFNCNRVCGLLLHLFSLPYKPCLSLISSWSPICAYNPRICCTTYSQSWSLFSPKQPICVSSWIAHDTTYSILSSLICWCYPICAISHQNHICPVFIPYWLMLSHICNSSFTGFLDCNSPICVFFFNSNDSSAGCYVMVMLAYKYSGECQTRISPNW